LHIRSTVGSFRLFVGEASALLNLLLNCFACANFIKPDRIIFMGTSLLDRIAQELMQPEIELIPQLAIDDPVIGQLALALKTEIQTGCLSGRLYGESLGTSLAERLVQNYAVTN
jgi:hypothetical protein